MSKKWPGGIITPTPATPSGPYQTSTAPGIWTLSQQSYWQKQNLWPTAGNVAPYGLFGGGTSTATGAQSSIVYFSIASTGSTSSFGNLTQSVTNTRACASSTRAVFGSGISGSYTNVASYVTIATTGNATFFGNLNIGINNTGFASAGCLANSTRGIWLGGEGNGRSSTIQYITIATTGNSTNFGGLINPATFNFAEWEGMAACASPTRGVIGGGYILGTGDNSWISYITIATTGNSNTFGNLVSVRYNPCGFSNSTRGIFCNGSGAGLSTIEYITIASTGNGTSFGALTYGTGATQAAASSTYGVFGAAYDATNVSAILITTLGNSTLWGTLSSAKAFAGSCSNVHGGL